MKNIYGVKYSIIRSSKLNKIWLKSIKTRKRNHEFCQNFHVSIVNEKLVLFCLECNKLYFRKDFKKLIGFDIRLKKGIKQLNQR